LKKSAFANAVILMRPENRNQIDPKYAKKIEGIVRKAPKGLKDLDDDSEVDYSPCPSCGVDLGTMETICFQCKATLPICIATVSVGREYSSMDSNLSLIFSPGLSCGQG
jgi:WD repeat-containing protein 19